MPSTFVAAEVTRSRMIIVGENDVEAICSGVAGVQSMYALTKANVIGFILVVSLVTYAVDHLSVDGNDILRRRERQY